MTLGVLFLAQGCILCVFALARAGEGVQHLHLGACQRNMQRESSNKAISPPGADSPGPCPARMPAQRLYASPALPSLRQLHASPARKSKNSGGSGRTPTHRRRRENEAAWWENEAARRGGEAASWESEKHAPPLFFSPALVRLLQARKRRQSTTARAPGSLPVSLSASRSKQVCSPKPRPAQPFC